ncbi:Nsp1-like C-terminal region-domain-containing protein [Gymnopilus junonius]|uniref:Nucleoporin NSP1 n=1 Tax=Gymnopilus junonius TaxID=109634 RepID=A0A9P5TTX4_GYMJU|nr:Nsp1-like C-terminal region-domain-containing protein [Gymnopilus junonius]
MSPFACLAPHSEASLSAIHSSALFAQSNTATGTGAAANVAPSAGGLFGNPPKTSTPALGSGGGMFGGASAPSTTGTPSLFGGGSNTSSPAPAIGIGGGLFGAGNIYGGAKTDSEAKKATSPTNPLFGGSSAFSLPKPGDTGAKPAAQPTTTSNAGEGGSGPTGSFAATATTSAPTVGSGLFGLPPKPATSSSTSAPSTSTGLFGGGSSNQSASTSTTDKAAPFSLGVNKDPSAAPTSNFFGGTTASKDGEKKDTASTSTSAFSLFGGTKPAGKKEETPAPKEGDKKETATATTSNTTSLIAVQPPSMLKGKSLEEIVNRWTSDLETNVREFNKFAAEVSVWDRVLIENGNNIAALYSHVLAAERQQNDINESLEHIEQQQKDLTTTLDHYEKASQEILGGSLRTLDTGPADNERDKNYMLATELSTQLDDLSGSLTQMIDSVNALSIVSKPAESAEDPLSQISQILSSHLESLQWIDGAVREVESKTNEVEKRIKDSGHSLPGSKVRSFGLTR